MAKDAVDRMLEQWKRERPDLDVTATGIFGRISRIAALVEQSMDRVFEPHALTGADFVVLAALRRSGKPYRLTPTALSRSMMVSSGGTTKRLDRLEARNLIRRDRSREPNATRSHSSSENSSSRSNPTSAGTSPEPSERMTALRIRTLARNALRDGRSDEKRWPRVPGVATNQPTSGSFRWPQLRLAISIEKRRRKTQLFRVARTIPRLSRRPVRSARQAHAARGRVGHRPTRLGSPRHLGQPQVAR